MTCRRAHGFPSRPTAPEAARPPWPPWSRTSTGWRVVGVAPTGAGKDGLREAGLGYRAPGPDGRGRTRASPGRSSPPTGRSGTGWRWPWRRPWSAGRCGRPATSAGSVRPCRVSFSRGRRGWRRFAGKCFCGGSTAASRPPRSGVCVRAGDRFCRACLTKRRGPVSGRSFWTFTATRATRSRRHGGRGTTRPRGRSASRVWKTRVRDATVAPDASRQSGDRDAMHAEITVVCRSQHVLWLEIFGSAACARPTSTRRGGRHRIVCALRENRLFLPLERR